MLRSRVVDKTKPGIWLRVSGVENYLTQSVSLPFVEAVTKRQLHATRDLGREMELVTTWVREGSSLMDHADGHQQSFTQTRSKTRMPYKVRPSGPQTWAPRDTLDTVGGGPIVFGRRLPNPVATGRSENRGSSREGGPSGSSEHY